MTQTSRRWRLAVALILACAAVLPVLAQPAPATPQDDFVPASQLPAGEQLPAAPMVIAAYAFVWVALLVYVWSLWRRIQSVERELADLSRRVTTPQE